MYCNGRLYSSLCCQVLSTLHTDYSPLLQPEPETEKKTRAAIEIVKETRLNGEQVVLARQLAQRYSITFNLSVSLSSICSQVFPSAIFAFFPFAIRHRLVSLAGLYHRRSSLFVLPESRTIQTLTVTFSSEMHAVPRIGNITGRK